MALDSPAVEDPALRSMSRLGSGIVRAILGLFLGGLILSGGEGAAQELAALLEPYRAASGREEVGTIRGMAFVEPHRPQGEASPLGGLTIVVFPPAPGLLSQLEGLKARVRDSAARYLGAAGDVRRIQEAYETALAQVGAADLVFTAATDQGGRFELKQIPAGEWVLLGRHEILHAMAPRKIPQQERAARLYVLEPPPRGYRAVTYWLLRLRVEAGAAIQVELHDRNLWLTAVAEEKTQGVIQKTTP